MPRWVWRLPLLLAVVLAGCAGLPGGRVDEALFADARFDEPAQPVDAAALFEVSHAMRDFVARELVGAADPRRALVGALGDRRLRLEYESTLTRTAAQAFDERAGNCLSLVAMTAALANAAGLPVRFQSVLVERTWSLSGDLVLAHGHVNVALGRRAARGLSAEAHDELVIDFLPPADLRGARTRELAPATVVAMYLNNRAAELLVAGDVDLAYWHAREAMRQDPAWLAAYNTLAVVYLRRDLPGQAEQVLRTVLARDGANTSAMANLVAALERLGRPDDAAAWRERLARAEGEAPLRFLALGQAALRAGDARTAARWFERELARDAHVHEAHAGLAAAHQALGDVERARRHLALALEASTARADRERYATKLERLGRAGAAPRLPGTVDTARRDAAS
jgi:Tfp pilus assembly protein PilF